jgi:hypothetical protein
MGYLRSAIVFLHAHCAIPYVKYDIAMRTQACVYVVLLLACTSSSVCLFVCSFVPPTYRFLIARRKVLPPLFVSVAVFPQSEPQS